MNFAHERQKDANCQKPTLKSRSNRYTYPQNGVRQNLFSLIPFPFAWFDYLFQDWRSIVMWISPRIKKFGLPI